MCRCCPLRMVGLPQLKAPAEFEQLGQRLSRRVLCCHLRCHTREMSLLAVQVAPRQGAREVLREVHSDLLPEWDQFGRNRDISKAFINDQSCFLFFVSVQSVALGRWKLLLLLSSSLSTTLRDTHAACYVTTAHLYH